MARKIRKYIDQIDKIMTCSIVNMEQKTHVKSLSSTKKRGKKRMKIWYKMQIGNVEHESSIEVT